MTAQTLPTARQCTDDLLKINLINSFSALPNSEQANIKRLDNLRETPVATHKVARPLINLVLPTTQDSFHHFKRRPIEMVVPSSVLWNLDRPILT